MTIKVYVKDRYIGKARNLHCCNTEPNGGCCEYMEHWQEGGGWSDRTYIYCGYLHHRIYLDPPIPNEKQIRDGDYYYLIPNDCPIRGQGVQMTIFDKNWK